MNIALIGYGKMGKAIEQIALEKGHTIGLKIDIDSIDLFTIANLQQYDVAIEFTGPHSAPQNIIKCFEAGVPVVSGSTGWLQQQWNNVAAECNKLNGGFLYASNFSIGVNIFFEVNKKLAALMNPHQEYDVTIEEIHHTQKKDAPSGTAITLADQIVEQIKRKTKWVNDVAPSSNELLITSKRIDPAPGTHSIKYHSAIDDIEITHTAHNRTGFAGKKKLSAYYFHLSALQVLL
jgi:4-hydroxy-tetrahydrodipicolinate reductase